MTFDSKAIKLVLNEHNDLRSKVAKGEATNGLGQKLPAAKNMNELVTGEMKNNIYLNNICIFCCIEMG